jgi:hypothetical protein
MEGLGYLVVYSIGAIYAFFFVASIIVGIMDGNDSYKKRSKDDKHRITF